MLAVEVVHQVLLDPLVSIFGLLEESCGGVNLGADPIEVGIETLLKLPLTYGQLVKLHCAGYLVEILDIACEVLGALNV